jgi:hypothetical protein
VFRGTNGLSASSSVTSRIAHSINGQDITDALYRFRGDESLTGLEIHLTSHSTHVAGMLKDAHDNPIQGYTVVVFSADSRHRTYSRFIATARPADGSFQMQGLPSGRYIAAVLASSLQPGRETDPRLLEQLQPYGEEISLREDETYQLDMKIATR